MMNNLHNQYLFAIGKSRVEENMLSHYWKNVMFQMVRLKILYQI